MKKIALVGRPNVGKSTLFNRITRTRRAIVTEVPGTTRDVQSAPASWLGWHFDLIDTGGMFGASHDPLHELIVQHGWRAVAAADLIIFIVDGQQGIVPADEVIAQEIQRLGVPAVLAVNKIDDKRAAPHLLDAHQLAFEAVYPISAEHGLGIDELLDAVKAALSTATGCQAHVSAHAEGERDTEASEERRELVIAVVGRPNVGKSSLVNQLLKEERVLVSELPGTTRDAIDGLVDWQGRRFRIVDTAGMRRPGKVARGQRVETLSVMLARRSLERADIAVIVIDAQEGATDQDASIAGEAERVGCGLVMAVNKWDLVKGRGGNFVQAFDDRLRRRLKFLAYAPILHLSARTGEHLPKLLETIDRVASARRRRVPTAELNRFVESITKAHGPSAPKGKEARILYAVQTAAAPPTFLFFTNTVARFHFSYERFLANRLREAFGFAGTPIRIRARAKRR